MRGGPGGIENWMARKIDQGQKRKTVEHAKNPEDLAQKFTLAQTTIEAAKINPESFTDTYSLKMMAQHRREVEATRANFNEMGDAERRGLIFEAAVLSGIKDGDMFGRDMVVFKTSDYDDIFNGADFVLEHTGDHGPASAALSVDSSTSPLSAEHKIEDITSAVAQGKLTEIQYFQTAHFKGRAFNIPRLVLGVERDTALEFDDLWYQVQKGKRPVEALKHTPVRGILIHETLMQLKAYGAYATKVGNKTGADAYRRGLSIVEHAVKAAKEDGVQINMHPHDAVHRKIIDSLHRFT